MNNDTPHLDLAGCSEEWRELCALSTSGELTAEESQTLREHVAACERCATLAREYTSLAQVGMAKLAAEFDMMEEVPAGYSEKNAERRLLAALHSSQPSGQAKVSPRVHLPDLSTYSGVFGARNLRFTFGMALGAAAVLLLFLGVAFELGRRTGSYSRDAMRVAMEPPRSTTPPPPIPPPAVLHAETEKLEERLAAAQRFVGEMSAQSSAAERRIAELSSMRASLVAQIDELQTKEQATTQSLGAVTEQRDALQQQLNDVAKSLTQVKQDLSRAEQDRQGALLRVTSLEREVDELHAEVSKANSNATNNDEFLAEDRDIRELMGARQLYIADVFDVQHDGRRSKAFGRVFYTRGKSLIFYAFDLQSQPGYREAKAFQAWGKPDSSSARPVNLGIFYLDSEKNRRWVLKADNPDLLAQINSVFVTIEPHGGSERPTSKPFLEAYLHSLSPNHP